MDTITIYKSQYDSMFENEYTYMTEYSKLKGEIIGFASLVKTNAKNETFRNVTIDNLLKLVKRLENDSD